MAQEKMGYLSSDVSLQLSQVPQDFPLFELLVWYPFNEYLVTSL
jgi:hypothetical protein